MRKIIVQLFWILTAVILNSCESKSIDIIENYSQSRAVVMPYISGESSFILNSVKEYTLWDTPIAYTVEWSVSNATIVSKNNKSITIKFDQSVSAVQLTANLYDTNEHRGYTARYEIKKTSAPSSYYIQGDNSIGTGESWIYKVVGLNENNYKDVQWSTSNNTLSLSNLTFGQTVLGVYYSQVLVKRKTTNEVKCSLYAKIPAGSNMITCVKEITLQKLNTIEDVEIQSSQGFNDARVQILNLPNDATISWEVIGDGYCIKSQSGYFIDLIVNNQYGESTVIATVNSNGKTKQFTENIKPQLDIKVKVIFTYIGYNSGGGGDVTIYNSDESFYLDFSSNGMEAVQYLTLTPGKYTLEGRGSPLNNLDYPLEIDRANFSDYINLLQISINIDDNNWHILVSRQHQ